MAGRVTLARWKFRDGFVAAAGYASDALDALVEGSRNLLLVGALGSMRPWGGLLSLGSISPSVTRRLFQLGDTYGGIYDAGATLGRGSILMDAGRSLWMIGAGEPHYAGTPIAGLALSTSLKVCLAASGTYLAANAYAAGLSRPAAPTVATGAAGNKTGPLSAKIARVRTTTGARSVASPTSNTVTAAAHQIDVTFPAASAGQDYWHVFFSLEGLGGEGLHFRAPYLSSFDVSEAAVAAAGGRTLSFNHFDSDLDTDTLAYVDDYAPPAGVFALRVGQSMIVGGAYADSVTAPSSTSPGTVAAVSLPNFYESYRPGDLLYFPEEWVDCYPRAADAASEDDGGEFAYVIHRSSVSFIRWAGYSEDGPSCVAGTVWGDTGFAHHYNVCAFYGRLAGIVAKGSLVMMGPGGEPDHTWGAEIRDFIKDWAVGDTVVGFHKKTLSLVVMHTSGVGLSYSLESKRWSPPCYFADAGYGGAGPLSAASVGDDLILSTPSALGVGNFSKWDGAGSPITVAAVTNWREPGADAGGRGCTVSELSAAFACTGSADDVFLAVHANLRPTFARDGAITSGASTLQTVAAFFTADHVGDCFAIFGDNVGAAGADYLVGRVSAYNSPTSVSFTALDGTALTAQATASGCHVVVGHDLTRLTLTRSGPQMTGPVEDIQARECLAVAVSVTLPAQGASARVSGIEARGIGATEPASRTA